jgi:hypothetical protein
LAIDFNAQYNFEDDDMKNVVATKENMISDTLLDIDEVSLISYSSLFISLYIAKGIGD